jgi:hypothetical protein
VRTWRASLVKIRLSPALADFHNSPSEPSPMIRAPCFYLGDLLDANLQSTPVESDCSVGLLYRSGGVCK